MALTRKLLAAMGIEADKVEEIISAHTETVAALKEQRDSLKADADRLPDVQKELDDLKKAVDAKSGDDGYEEKYKQLKDEYEQYKQAKEKEESEARVRAAYRKLLEDADVSKKRIDTVLKVSDLSQIKLDKEGNIIDADTLTDGIKTEWADFITTHKQTGADTATPPEGNSSAPQGSGRAAELAARYHENRYGAASKEDK